MKNTKTNETSNLGLNIMAWALLISGWGLLILSILFTLTIFGAIIGIPMGFMAAILIVAGIWVKKQSEA